MAKKTKKVKKNHKLSIYLVKETVEDAGEIITDLKKFTKSEMPEYGTFYFSKSKAKTPEWADFFDDRLDSLKLKSISYKGIFLIHVTTSSGVKRLFALTFGFGWTALNPNVIERKFGLKVVLNTVNHKELRKLNSKNLSHNPKDVSEQLSKSGERLDFSLDIERDILRSIAGKSTISDFGSFLSGKDALSVSVPRTLKNIKDFLVLCYEKYESKDYKLNFGWVDHVAEITDPTEIAQLDNLLLREFTKADPQNLWLAVPEVLEWEDLRHFNYSTSNDTHKPEDLSLDDFKSTISNAEIRKLDLDSLKKIKVYGISAKSGERMTPWSIYECIYSEISHKGRTNILINASWYNLDQPFVTEINNKFVSLVKESQQLGFDLFEHDDEDHYNQDMTKKDSSYWLMDKKYLYHGGTNDKNEHCDIYSSKKYLIHVKIYRGSSCLSHLFNQALVSAELMISDAKYVDKVNKHLPKTHSLPQKINAEEFHIYLMIIKRHTKDFDLPFFSKVTLKNACKLLNQQRFKVHINHINYA